ncbi:epoxide hydrolase family protein [Rhizorhabdus wittichii]|uniref:epoxide hydrolase family protein n=1 Tax=Rhizorhabdus wittichii TaxID=160791 RepID=UPI000371AC94|nr:epoxide hydrolase family protein [Rhizorhabdus wittichii]
MREFQIAVTDDRLAAIRRKVASFPWTAMPEVQGWRSGTGHSFMRNLSSYWLDGYDWRVQETLLNQYPQHVAFIDDIPIRFYFVQSADPSAKALLLLHGWPGSAFEFHHLIEPLTNPDRHGDQPCDSFHVVIPCLPGFGFSGRPATPIGPEKVAAIFSKLMTETLGYKEYISQGGDWGAIIATMIGYQDPDHCTGIHLNMLPPPAGQPIGAEEVKWAETFSRNQFMEGAYAQIQMTKPQTLGFAMTDSPMGVAAWIVEKFAGWSDLPRDQDGEPDVLARYSYDQLLNNIMFYLAEDSFITASWLYHAYLQSRQKLPFVHGVRCPTRMGYAAFPDPVFHPQPQSMAARTFNIVHWSEMPRGGHFAALEAPDLLVQDVRAFARLL